jgi:hypothetical protein
MPYISYADEKMTAAISGISVSSKPLQTRILNAFMSFHTIREKDLSNADLRAQFGEIMRRLTADKSDEHRGYAPPRQ